ncbi:hypothetical protein GKKCFE_19660 [Pseudomonas sp. E141]
MVYTQGNWMLSSGFPLPGKLVRPSVLQSDLEKRGKNLLCAFLCRYSDSARNVQLLKDRSLRNPRKDLEHACHLHP